MNKFEDLSSLVGTDMCCWTPTFIMAVLVWLEQYFLLNSSKISVFHSLIWFNRWKETKRENYSTDLYYFKFTDLRRNSLLCSLTIGKYYFTSARPEIYKVALWVNSSKSSLENNPGFHKDYGSRRSRITK